MSPVGVLFACFVGLAVLLGPAVLFLYAWDCLSAGKPRQALRLARASLVGAFGPYALLAGFAAVRWIGAADPWDAAGAIRALLPRIPTVVLLAGIPNAAVFLGAWWVLHRAEEQAGTTAADACTAPRG